MESVNTLDQLREKVDDPDQADELVDYADLSPLLDAATRARLPRLNQIQHWALVVGLLLFLISVLFPPYVAVIDLEGPGPVIRSIGHGFLFGPPNAIEGTHEAGWRWVDWDEQVGHVRLDWSRLTLEWFAIVALTGLGLLCYRPRHRTE